MSELLPESEAPKRSAGLVEIGFNEITGEVFMRITADGQSQSWIGSPEEACEIAKSLSQCALLSSERPSA
jgi:hypothetical protein